MKGYLIDTSVALRGLGTPELLPKQVRSALLKGPNFLSTIVYWEVLLKSMKGKLDVGDPRSWWADALLQLAATPVPLRPEHLAEVYDLAPIHQDPFDRVLVAQAMVEEFTLVTTDGTLPLYASARLRVLH